MKVPLATEMDPVLIKLELMLATVESFFASTRVAHAGLLGINTWQTLSSTKSMCTKLSCAFLEIMYIETMQQFSLTFFTYFCFFSIFIFKMTTPYQYKMHLLFATSFY